MSDHVRTINGQEKWWHTWTRAGDFWRDLLLSAGLIAVVLYVDGWSGTLLFGFLAGVLLMSAVLGPPLECAMNEIKQALGVLDGEDA